MARSPDDPTTLARRHVHAALDHHASACGYRAIPETARTEGGWRRLYVRAEGETVLAVLGADGAPWVSLGVEVSARRSAVAERLALALSRLAPFEVAYDPDAGPDPNDPECVVRVALRVFVDGLAPGVVREAVGNLSAAAAEIRRVLE